MDQADRRKQEIAAKKAKLELLRQQRIDRQAASTALPVHATSSPSAETRAQERKQIDDLVNALVGDAQSKRSSRPTTNSSTEARIPTPKPAESQKDAAIEHVPALESVAVVGVQHAPPVNGIGPVKRETVMYTKATQTVEDAESEVDTDDDEIVRAAAAEEAAAQATLAAQEELIAKLRVEIRAELVAKEEEERQRQLAEEPPPLPPGVIDTEQIIQRYTAEDLNLDADDQNALQIRMIAQLQSPQSAHRSITYLHFSPKFPELVLAAYSRNPLAPGEPDGLIQVYSLLKPETPIFTFTAGSEIRIAQFSPFHPQLIFGGAYSGQVLIWDTRKPGLPILKSPQTAGRGHSHPVTAMQLVGTKHAHSLVSIAADGTICSWSVDVLAKPQEFLQLRNLPPSKLDDIAPTGLAVDATDSTRFLIATEEGHVLRVNRQDRADAKAGVDPRIIYRGHTAAITSLDQHPASLDTGREGTGINGWVLTSSLDWSVKLWATTTTPRPSAPPASSNQSYDQFVQNEEPTVVVPPIFDFPNTQPVYDARWAPHRPGVFAQVDGGGELQIWDLCQSTEVPVAHAMPQIIGADGPARALNRVTWEPEHGRRIAVGGLDGVLIVLDVGEHLGGSATQEEWTNLATLVQSLT